MVDILHRDPNGWNLYEVKSSTGVKPVHINDVAIQYYVLNGCGLDVSSASLVHINNQYVRSGDLDIQKLFIIADITEDVLSSQDFVQSEISAMKAMLQDYMPVIDIGAHCSLFRRTRLHKSCSLPQC